MLTHRAPGHHSFSKVHTLPVNFQNQIVATFRALESEYSVCGVVASSLRSSREDIELITPWRLDGHNGDWLSQPLPESGY